MRQDTGPFVGRDETVKQLQLLLDRAGAMDGQLVLIAGEAGIGKTRLCAQLSEAQRDRGAEVLLGRCAPEESTITLAPIADTLRMARRSAPSLWAAAAARADLLRTIVPELDPRASPSDSPDRLVVFEALLDAIEETERDSQATFWVLDDVQWADDASWHFLRYILRRLAALRLVVAVTYRDDELGPTHSRWSALAQLRRDPCVSTIMLPRLTLDDAERVVRARAPGLPATAVSGILERSAGTPLLIEELAQLAEGADDLPPVPDIVRIAVRERAARLGPVARDLLDVMAVAGLATEAELLERLRPEADPDELVAVGLVETDTTRFRFRHPLLQESAYGAVPRSRRRLLHHELATALGAGDGHQPERVAVHLEAAGRPLDALAALAAGIDAARAAGDAGTVATLSLAAYHCAGRHAAGGHAAGGDAASRCRRDALQLAAIRELYLIRRWSELEPLVLDAWPRRQGFALVDRVAVTVARGWQLFAQGKLSDAEGLLRRELAELQQVDTAGIARTLRLTAAYVAWLRGDIDQAVQDVAAGRSCDESGEDPGSSGDPVTDWWAQHQQIHNAYRLTGERTPAIAAYRANIASAEALGIGDGAALAAWDVACHTAARGDIETGLAIAQRAGTQSTAQDLQVLKAAVLLLAGEVETAESLLVRFGPRIRLGEPVSGPWVEVCEAMLHLHRGQLGEARRRLYGPDSAREAAQTEYHRADRALALGWLAWESGQWVEVDDQLAGPLSRWWTGCWATLVGGPMFLPLHVDALLRLNRGPDAAGQVEAAAHADPGAAFLQASLAAARFRLDPGPERARQAEALAGAAPWPWLCALVRLWRAELLGDEEAARSAAVLFEEIGNPLGLRRAERLLSRFGVPPPKRATLAGPLSQREIEVARLVAEGLTNRAIASRLYIGRPTVASHVVHILTKLGFSSRTQIAAWVASATPVHR